MMNNVVNRLAQNYLSNLKAFANEMYDIKTRENTCKKIRIPNDIKIKARRNEFIFSMSKIYNKLPENIITAPSVNSFKSNIKKHMKNNKIAIPANFLKN